MANIYDMSDTWNDGATTFTSIKMNVVDSASASGSLLMDLQVGGSSRFSVGKAGHTKSSGFYLDSGLTKGLKLLDGNNVGLTINNKSVALDVNGDFAAPRTLWLGSGTYGGKSVALAADGGDTLAQRNGTSTQTFRLYKTYTDASNYERGGLTWNSIANALVLEPQKAGTGASREMWIRGVGGSYARFKTDNQIDVSGGGSVNVVFKNSTTEFLDTPIIASPDTVATLPGTPAVGMIARVTDASAPAVGSTVTGGGAANALCWYNGTNWTVIGV